MIMGSGRSYPLMFRGIPVSFQFHIKGDIDELLAMKGRYEASWSRQMHQQNDGDSRRGVYGNDYAGAQPAAG